VPIVPYVVVVGSVLGGVLLTASWMMPPAEPLPFTSSFDGLPHPFNPPGEVTVMTPPRETVMVAERAKAPPPAPAAKASKPKKKRIARPRTHERAPYYAQTPPYARGFTSLY
jgi:hypothetical protein